MIKIVINNIYSRIIGDLPNEVNAVIYDTLAYKYPGAQHIISVKKKKWDGIIRLYHRSRGQQFYTGLLGYIRDIFKEYDIAYTSIDQRSFPVKNLPNLEFIPPKKYEERDYQTFTIDRSIKFTRGILGVSTGGGKTMIVARLIGELQTAPFIFYVLTKDLMEQAHGVLSECLNDSIGKIGDGICDIKKINVCTIQTAVRALNWKNKEFNISDYKFDEEDRWNEKEIESEEKAESIRNIIQATKGLYMDECIAGDSKIFTELGEISIEDAIEKKCKLVKTHDGIKITYKPILNYWSHKEKEIIKIELENGKFLRCTKDHLVCSQNGWISAKNLKKSDNVYYEDAGRKLSQYILKNRDFINIQHPCSTSWKAIKNIKKVKSKVKVYDIEVQDTHCFFTNNILVHNCHHTSARTVQDVLGASQNAYWRFGGSATPYRESGDDIMIQAMFGGKIVDISASYLIKRDFLLKPYIIFEPVESKSKYSSYAKIYKQCVSDNDDFNFHVAEEANHLVSRGLSVLVLVKHYHQGDFIEKYIPDCVFVTGRMTTKKRTKAINDLRTREKMCIIATSLADEGLDIPSLNCVLIAGGGASATRMNQRVGRTIRISDEINMALKDKSIVIVYDHYGVKYLKDHTKKIRRIFKSESEFKIVESNGRDYILDEIDEIIGIETEKKSLFDV